MARVTKYTQNQKRARLVARTRLKRLKIKHKIKNTEDSETIIEALDVLNKMPRKTSATAYRRICQLCGRSRGVYRKVGICRCCFRIHAMKGHIPGLHKASW